MRRSEYRWRTLADMIIDVSRCVAGINDTGSSILSAAILPLPGASRTLFLTCDIEEARLKVGTQR